MLPHFKVPVSSSTKPLWVPDLPPRVQPTYTALQSKFSTQSPISLPCKAGAHSAGSWRPTRAPQCPSTPHVERLSTAHAPVGRCSGCLHRLPRIAAQPVSPIVSLSCLVLPAATLSLYLALQISTSVPRYRRRVTWHVPPAALVLLEINWALTAAICCV